MRSEIRPGNVLMVEPSPHLHCLRMVERTSSIPVAFSLALTLLTSCRKESDGARWDVDVAVPLVRTTLTIGDLVPDSLLAEDAEGNVMLLYDTRLFALDLDTVLSAPDTSFRYSYFPPGGFNLTLFPNTTFNSQSNFTRFELDDLELRELWVRSGQVNMQVVNRVATNVIGNFSLPGATLNGQPLTLQVTAPPGTAASPSSLSTVQDLSGYRFDLRGPDLNDVNTLTTTQAFTTDPAGPQVVMSTADSLEAVISYTGIVPQYARGYFGTRVIDLEEGTTTLNVFNDLSGALQLQDATARLKVLNGLGAEIRVDVQHLRSLNATTGQTVDLSHAIITNPLNIDRAIDLGGSFQPALNQYILNAGNSNLLDFLENLPTSIGYDLDITLDPLGDVSNGNDFLYYESTLAADLELSIPLHIAATDLTLTTTTDPGFEGTLENHAVQAGVLHVFADNGFPFSATVELAIVDENGTVYALLTPGGTVQAANVDNNGQVTSTTQSQVDFTVSAEQMNLFYPGDGAGANGGLLRIRAAFNTAGQLLPVQVRADQTLGIAISFEGTYMVNGDE